MQGGESFLGRYLRFDLPTGIKMAAIIRSAAITHVGSRIGFHALSLCCRRARSGGRLAPGTTSGPCGMVATNNEK